MMAQSNVVDFLLPPRRLTWKDMEATFEGESAALQANEQNPYPQGTSKHASWEFGYKFGVGRLIALWHGPLEPYQENTLPSREDDDGSYTYYEMGQRIARALGEEKLREIKETVKPRTVPPTGASAF